MSLNTSIVKIYLKRDEAMAIDPKQQIMWALEKLGYLNINATLAKKNAFVDCITEKVRSLMMDDVVPTNEEIKEHIKNVGTFTEYKKVEADLDRKIERAVQLSKFIGSTDIAGFYNALTYDELMNLGY